MSFLVEILLEDYRDLCRSRQEKGGGENMSKADNNIIREVLAENEEKIVKEIQEKENMLLEVNKKYYEIILEKEFKEFSHDSGYREIEVPIELYNDRDELEKMIRVLKNKLSKYRNFKEQTENQLKD